MYGDDLDYDEYLDFLEEQREDADELAFERDSVDGDVEDVWGL